MSAALQMHHDETPAEPEITEITRANVDELLNARRIQVEMKSGRWWDIRRNGQTKVFPRAKRLVIPFKAGLKVHGQIREWDFGPDGRMTTPHFRIKPTA